MARSRKRGSGGAAVGELGQVVAAQIASMEVRSVADFVLDEANVRRRDERANEAIDRSLAEYGPARSIVVGKEGVVRAGNGTLERFAALGGREVLLVRPAPGQLVAVHRDDLTPTQEVGLSIADNRTTDLSSNDLAELAAVLASLDSEGFDLEAAGYTVAEFEALKESLAAELASGGEPADKGSGLALISEVCLEEPKAVVSAGDVIKLGPHTLVCGDVLRDWELWAPLLKKGCLFCPYPSPYLPLGTTKSTFVMVQPDTYLCAVMVDLFELAGQEGS